MSRDATPMVAIRPVSIRLESQPILNQLNSLAALKSAPLSTGLADWIYSTDEQLTSEQRKRNHLLFALLGLHAIMAAAPPDAATKTLAEYAEALLKVESEQFRDALLAMMLAEPLPSLSLIEGELPAPLADPLADEALFAQHFEQRLGFGSEAEWSQLYQLLLSPATLQLTIASHLQMMWQDLLAVEWGRIEADLAASVEFLRRIDITGFGVVEALARITGRNIGAILTMAELEQFDTIVAVPSLHNGPYITPLVVGEVLYILFGARLPPQPAPLPAHTDIALNRLKAISDETRMRILMALQKEGAMSTQAIMDRFGLSKSAASRHLRFLQATELVEFERVDKTKKLYRCSVMAMAETIAFMQKNFV